LLTYWKLKSLNRTGNCKIKAGCPTVVFRHNFTIYLGIREVKLNTTLNVDKAFEEYSRNVHFDVRVFVILTQKTERNLGITAKK
jgi:hypothetical protein